MNINTNYGSLELFFSYVPDPDLSITLITNIAGVASFSEIEINDLVTLPISVKISLESEGGVDLITCSTLLDNIVVDKSDYPCDSNDLNWFDIRIFIFNGRISVYMNTKWVYSYNLYKVTYPVDVTTVLKPSGAAVTITNIRKVELNDGREAVFVDYESTADSAISLITQDRPIEYLVSVDRAGEFTYSATKDPVIAHKINSYEVSESDNSQTSSDGLVYYMDVGISIDEHVAEILGLITRLYRLSELDSGVDRAITSIQKRARQSRIRITSTGRLNPLLEVADIHIFNGLVVSGTKRVINDRSILEDINITVQDGDYSQSLSGRRDVDNV